MAVDAMVVDYGIGNLFSVRRSLEHCGASVVVTSEPCLIRDARRVVLPGVGAFPDGMSTLRQHGLDEVVRSVADKGVPLLAVCLGMQMLFDESEEFGTTAGLGLIPGKVVALPSTDAKGGRLKIPHIGWEELRPPAAAAGWRSGALGNIRPGEAVYFVHSFMAEPARKDHRLADCVYGGVSIAAAVGRDNIIGYQFHPEKSGDVGLRLLKSFLSL
jgi:imidazole glycerol-phosphate synthase subunit HisH